MRGGWREGSCWGDGSAEKGASCGGKGTRAGRGTLERPHANGPACQELADLALSKPQGLGCTPRERRRRNSLTPFLPKSPESFPVFIGTVLEAGEGRLLVARRWVRKALLGS